MRKDHSLRYRDPNTGRLGNGSSVSAVLNGKCIDTSMGLTPVQGLMMGTRAGDVGAGAISYMMTKENLTIDQALDVMNKKSGILGISGKSSDLREVLQCMQDGDDSCRLAVDMVAYNIKKYVTISFQMKQEEC